MQTGSQTTFSASYYLCFTSRSTITSVLPFYITHRISLNKWLVCRGVCIQKISRVFKIGIWNDGRVFYTGCDGGRNRATPKFCCNNVNLVFDHFSRLGKGKHWINSCIFQHFLQHEHGDIRKQQLWKKGTQSVVESVVLYNRLDPSYLGYGSQ